MDFIISVWWYFVDAVQIGIEVTVGIAKLVLEMSPWAILIHYVYKRLFINQNKKGKGQWFVGTCIAFYLIRHHNIPFQNQMWMVGMCIWIFYGYRYRAFVADFIGTYINIPFLRRVS